MSGSSRHTAPHRPSTRLRRVLLYTHNSIGLGHAIRCLAVITGMRRHRPDLDFLVLTGSALPQLFLAEQVEVLKLPSLRQELIHGGPLFQPRYLKSLAAAEVVRLRQGLIRWALEGFAPDAVLVEHYPAGLLGEALPLLERRAAAGAGRRAYVLAHLGRGQPHQPRWPQLAVPDLEELLGAYDLLYVLDHPPAEGSEPGQAPGPGARERLRYLGPVTSRLPGELPPRRDVLARLGLPDRGLVLLSLGRGGPVVEMARSLLAGLPGAGLGQCGVLLVLDPYLTPGEAAALQRTAQEYNARAVPFVPCLVEAVAAADLVVCRAGCNTVAELMMTGTPALVVPERHPSGEQERRCLDLPPRQVVVASQDQIVSGAAAGLLRRAAGLPRGPGRGGYDRYAVGQRLVEDLEAWLETRQPAGVP